MILIEFNELTPSLMDRFIGEGRLPNFKRFRDESHVFVTDAEEDGELLNPWVQWITVHCGLSAAEHGITKLSEGHKLAVKAVWDHLTDAGHTVWVCGSMNARYDRPLKGYLLPDPWSLNLPSFPAGKFDPFYRFVSGSVQEHTNESLPSAKVSAASFVWFMLRNGLSFRTAWAIARQLLSERGGRNKWKRAAILDRLQFDVFRYIYRKARPDFATFFLNSTAHFQHAYWRHHDPEAFTVKPPAAELAEYGGAVTYGYEQMDRIIGDLMNLAPDATLVFCTALSQQPYLKKEDIGGRHYYRLKGPEVFGTLLGVTDSFQFNPVMADQAMLRFADEAARQRAEAMLSRFRFAGTNAFVLQPDGAQMMIQCRHSSPVAEDATLTEDGGTRTPKFLDVFYPMNVIKSGMHHPDGMLWVRYPTREHQVHEGKLSIRAIAPMILDHFGIERSRNGMPALSGLAISR
jgi:hypothetical protein